MAHAQQQILDALQAVLVAGATVAGVRVFVDRVDPLQPSELPAILIDEDAGGESAETDDLDGNERRELGVVILCVLSASSDAAASARAFGLAVEKLVSPSTALRTLSQTGPRMTSSRMLQNGDGDRLFGGRQQTWLIDYCVYPSAPDVIL
jgi:hypothetical protein